MISRAQRLSSALRGGFANDASLRTEQTVDPRESGTQTLRFFATTAASRADLTTPQTRPQALSIHKHTPVGDQLRQKGRLPLSVGQLHHIDVSSK